MSWRILVLVLVLVFATMPIQARNPMLMDSAWYTPRDLSRGGRNLMVRGGGAMPLLPYLSHQLRHL